MLGVSNHMSLQSDVSGYHQLIPFQRKQLKEFFKYTGSSSIFKPRVAKPPDTKDMFLKAMFPVLNFFTIMYLDDIIICFKNDKDYLYYLKKMYNKGRSENQRYREKQQADT